MRPNLFANTPDILHAYLQRGGRPAFQVRLVLAATLGASYGIYSGFELSENVPVKEGSEEYLDSEKYQIRPRDFEQAGSLAELVGRINAIRRDHPALQHDWGLAFHQTDNARDHRLQQAIGRRPRRRARRSSTSIRSGCSTASCSCRWRTGASRPTRRVEVLDLLSGERYFWRGEWNYVRLDPQSRVAHILHVSLHHPVP